MPIVDRIGEFHDEMTTWRRDIHTHPELEFDEHRTSDLVATRFEAFGLEVYHGIGRTGVAGALRVGNSPRSVGLRADMDALPIQAARPLALASSPNRTSRRGERERVKRGRGERGRRRAWP